MRKIQRKEALAGRLAPESGGSDPRPFAKGAFRGCGGFVGHTEFVSRPGFILAVLGLRFVSLSLLGPCSAAVLAVPRLRWFR